MFMINLAMAQAQDLFLAPAQSQSDTNVWFGEGCFWERQFAYALLELDPAGPFNRSNASVTSVVGYGGSLRTDGGHVCYENSDFTDYGTLGHAEQVRITLDSSKEEEQFKALVDDFFASFTPTESGFERPDPMDAGSPYRVTVSIPGGVNGTLYPILAAANVPRGPYNLTMNLVDDQVGDETDDEFNTVFVMDGTVFPFYQGEQYHQFHSNFFGAGYPEWYTNDLWQLQISVGKIPLGGSTGCPDDPADHF